MNRKVLLIAGSFYPHPYTAAIRVNQFAQFLPESGFKPYVLCRYYGPYASRQILDQYVHSEVQLDYLNPPRSSAPETDFSQSLRRRARVWLGSRRFMKLMVPGPSVVFWRRVRLRALELVRQVDPGVILSSSPPHSVHDLSLYLHRQTSIPLIVDWQDPYTIDPRFQPRGIARLMWGRHRRFEKSLYKHAALNVHCIPTHARWASRQFPFASSRIRTLLNGVPETMEQAMKEPIAPTPPRRSIRIVGWAGDDQLHKIAMAIHQQIDHGHDLDLSLIGQPPSDADSLRQRLGDRLIIHGPVAHDQALRYMAGGDVLLCVLSPERASHIRLSCKLFEYLATGRPVVVINPTRSDRHLLRSLNGVEILEKPDIEQIGQALARALQPEAAPPAEQVTRFRQQYSRRAQTAQLAQWMNEVIESYSES